MEVVQNFNKEMKGLLDHRPPVSRQKMSMITKSAIRGIKFYKHIVQSVEKFIQKCSPDYKVPGLYVMDAIIRQSRHQYGAERDVFAPRFLKNLLPTFQQLFRCDEKDRPLVIRVLNLWLKNETFPPEVIQSLLSLADNPEDANLLALAEARVSVAITNQATASASSHRPKRPHHHHHHHQHHKQRGHHSRQDFVDNNDEDQTGGVAMETSMPPVGDGEGVDYDAIGGISDPMMDSTNPDAAAGSASAMPQGGIISSVAELLQKFQDTDDVRDQINQLQSLQDKILQQSSLLSQQQMIDPEILGQLQALMEELTKTARAAVEREQEAQRAKDVVAYDYGDDSDDEDNIGGSNGFQRRSGASMQPSSGVGFSGGGVDQNFLDQLQQMTETLAQTRVLQEQLQSARMRQQLEEQQQQQQQVQEDPYYHQPHQVSYEEGEIDDESKGVRPSHHNSSSAVINNNNNNNYSSEQAKDADFYQRSSAHSSAVPSSSSTSRRRRRSHSGGRGESSERRRKERKRKSLPRLRDGRLSIVSATIFIGKLQKSTTEGRLRSLLDEYGQVQALVLIPSRGCGFVVYSKRKHAAKAIDKLRSTRLDGATLRVAWAPNKGIKDTEMKEFWDEEEGCTYIPYDKFPRDDSWRDLLQGGAFIDQDSVPLELADLVRQTTPRPEDAAAVAINDSAAAAVDLASVGAAALRMPPPPPPPPPPPAVMGGVTSMALNLPPPPPPPPQLAQHLMMMGPPPMPPQMSMPPQFPPFMPPPPPPPPSQSSTTSTLTSQSAATLNTTSPLAAKQAESPAAAVTTTAPRLSKPLLSHSQSQQRTTLLPMPTPPRPPPPSPQQQPHQQHQPYVRTPIPSQRPPRGFFRGGIGGPGGTASGFLPPPLLGPQFRPRGAGVGGIGAWRGGAIRRGL